MGRTSHRRQHGKFLTGPLHREVLAGARPVHSAAKFGHVPPLKSYEPWFFAGSFSPSMRFGLQFWLSNDSNHQQAEIQTRMNPLLYRGILYLIGVGLVSAL